jgi:hypothetical protein|eukprot:COSAG01_NODE_2492_length_7583_cov_4.761491_6_plen_44_part_00
MEATTSLYAGSPAMLRASTALALCQYLLRHIRHSIRIGIYLKT